MNFGWVIVGTQSLRVRLMNLRKVIVRTQSLRVRVNDFEEEGRRFADFGYSIGESAAKMVIAGILLYQSPVAGYWHPGRRLWRGFFVRRRRL